MNALDALLGYISLQMHFSATCKLKCAIATYNNYSHYGLLHFIITIIIIFNTQLYISHVTKFMLITTMSWLVLPNLMPYWYQTIHIMPQGQVHFTSLLCYVITIAHLFGNLSIQVLPTTTNARVHLDKVFACKCVMCTSNHYFAMLHSCTLNLLAIFILQIVLYIMHTSSNLTMLLHLQVEIYTIFKPAYVKTFTLLSALLSLQD